MSSNRSRSYEKKLDRAKYAIFVILILSLMIFLVIAGLAVLNEGVGKFVHTLESINLFYYSLALLAVFLSVVIGFPKWDMFIKKLKVRIGKRKNFEVYMSMFAMDVTPGRWGRAVVSYTLCKITGVKFECTFPAVVADIFTDFLGFVVVAVFSSFLVQKYSLISVVIGGLLILPFVFIYTKKPFNYLKRRFGKNRRLKGFFNMGDTYFRSHRMLDRSTYAYAMLFTIPSVALNGIALYLVTLSFGIHLSVYQIPTLLFIYTSALLIGMVTGIPGTLGVTDAALLGYLIAFFHDFGIDFGVASAITIFFRIASMWFVEGVGFAFLLRTLKYWKLKKRSGRRDGL